MGRRCPLPPFCGKYFWRILGVSPSPSQKKSVKQYLTFSLDCSQSLFYFVAQEIYQSSWLDYLFPKWTWIFVPIMREIMSFSGEIYNGSKKFTLPPVVPVVTNITSLLKRPIWWWCDDYRNKGQNQGSILFLLKYHLKKNSIQWIWNEL